jgi:hypothetical protein
MSMVLRGKTVLKEPVPEEPPTNCFRSDGNRKLANSASKWIGRLRRRFQRTKLPKTPEIKKGHPVVRVAVYDTVECSDWIIELPAT